MAESLAQRIAPDAPVRLDDYPTTAPPGASKAAGTAALAPLIAELGTLQDLMWGAGTHALLLVLQGRDAAGKDSLIKHVFAGITPAGQAVTSFKPPTAPEAAHDFLWRVHAAAPARGICGIFNRSHYEQVLAVRVHALAPAAAVEAAYGQINDFERLLTSSNTILVKCYLHLSAAEQRVRLLAREQAVRKAWKLNPGDWAERERWEAYRTAYEVALSRCSPAHAPWYIVPADQKWAARLAVAQVLVATLRPYRAGWTAQLTALQQARLQALAGVAKR